MLARTIQFSKNQRALSGRLPRAFAPQGNLLTLLPTGVRVNPSCPGRPSAFGGPPDDPSSGEPFKSTPTSGSCQALSRALPRTARRAPHPLSFRATFLRYPLALLLSTPHPPLAAGIGALGRRRRLAGAKGEEHYTGRGEPCQLGAPARSRAYLILRTWFCRAPLRSTRIVPPIARSAVTRSRSPSTRRLLR